ncbi:MAG: helix-turn-helix domain-containing protein [Phycisphaerales bacterium]
MTTPASTGSREVPDPPLVMTIDDLATYLQIAKSTLYKLAQEGKVPGQKVGKHWRFHREAIDEWLKTQSKESAK